MTDDAFRIAFTRAQEHFKLSDRQLSDILHVSMGTIERWKSGKNLPFRTLRATMLGALVKHAPEAGRPVTELDTLKRKMLSTKAGSCAILVWSYDKAPSFLKEKVVGECSYIFLVPPGEKVPALEEYTTEELDIGDGFGLVVA